MYGYSVRCFADTSTTPEPIAVDLVDIELYNNVMIAESLTTSSISSYTDGKVQRPKENMKDAVYVEATNKYFNN